MRCTTTWSPSFPAIDRLAVKAVQHLIESIVEKRDGPTLIVIGGIHGNEAAGVEAMRQIAPLVDALRPKLRGRVYLIAGNTRALQRGIRFVGHDLNRAWIRKYLDSVGTPDLGQTAEGAT